MTNPYNNGWLRIESAPMDGTIILLGDFTDRYQEQFIGHFNNDKYWNRWEYEHCCNREEACPVAPTHWQPLLKPPMEITQ